MSRIRHCVECPQCRTRYLISLSPYRNGSYLIPTMDGSSEEFVLYCSCNRATVASRWKWSEGTSCEVSKEAYERGYGMAEEIVPVNNPSPGSWEVNVSRYLNWKSVDKRKNSA
jgi:hypothetical protein